MDLIVDILPNPLMIPILPSNAMSMISARFYGGARHHCRSSPGKR
jgi:hypothetical protein